MSYQNIWRAFSNVSASLLMAATLGLPLATQATEYQEGEYTVFSTSKYYFDDQWNGNAQNLMVLSNLNTSNSGSSWNVTWNYPNNGLKYPSIHMGWHWGFPANYPSTTTGLPFQLASGHTVSSTWQYNFANTASTVKGSWSGVDISYDCWFHWLQNPTYQDQPNYEMMIFNANINQDPVGGLLESGVVIDGITYELWGGQNGAFYTFSFRSTNATNNTQNATHTVNLNITDFTNYLINDKNGQAQGFSKWLYLQSIEAGAENYSGNGHLYTYWYQSDVH